MGTETPGPGGALLGVVDVLERLGIPYVIGGSIASAAHGEFRSTNDADVLIELKADQVPGLLEALGPGYYIEESAVLDALSRRGSFNVIDSRGFEKVDLFVSGGSLLDRCQLQNARLMTLPGFESRPVRVTAPEEIVIRKLVWFRSGRHVSDRQWRDVLGVLKVTGASLNREAMASLADASGVLDLLRKALSESGA